VAPSTVLGIAALLAATFMGPAQAQVTGAGSTFAQLVLSEWSQAYQRTQADAEFQPVGAALDYEPIGSQGGIMRVREAAVDFGATDVPLRSEELAKLGLAQFPFVIGGVVAVVSVPGVGPGQMRLTGELLADIYLGKVTTWADQAVAAVNPGLALPDAPIAVVHRSDGSGTTFNFPAFLSAHSPRWQAEVGHDLLVRWPTGAGVKGNDGVAAAVGRTANAIGYVDFAQARRAGLSYALVRNRAGTFVRPGVESFQAAATSADWQGAADFDLPLTDAPAPEAYPIVAVTFALMPR
jgi:phosphate transport system substrate-binding protein